MFGESYCFWQLYVLGNGVVIVKRVIIVNDVVLGIRFILGNTRVAPTGFYLNIQIIKERLLRLYINTIICEAKFLD